jgi:hypothetical protein
MTVRPRQPLTRGQQRPRKPRRRRRIDAHWSSLGLILGAAIGGLIALWHVPDEFLHLGGSVLKYVLLVLVAIIVWQNQGLLKTWGRAVIDSVKR